MFYRSIFLAIISIGLSATYAFSQDNPIQQQFERATKLLEAGDLNQSISIYEELSIKYPKFAPIYFYLGIAYKNQGRETEEVRKMFEKVIELDPKYEIAYEYLGKLNYELGNFLKAEEFVLKAIEINPNNSRTQLTLGWIYLLGLSQPQNALPYFENVSKSLTDNPYVYLGLGIAYYKTDQRENVLDAITKLRSMNEDGLAIELESVLRSNDFASLRIPGLQEGNVNLRRPSTLVGDYMPETHINGNKDIERMPVRLSGKVLNVGDYSNSLEVNNASSLTALEKIKALQQKGYEINNPQ